MGAPLAIALGVGLVALREHTRRRDRAAVGFECHGDPAPPSHLKILQGVAPTELQSWAAAIVHDPTTTFGQVFERVFGDKTIAARVEHHTWTTHGADVIPGCFKGVTLYEHKDPNIATAGDDNEQPPTDDTVFFPLGGGQWCGFPSGEILDSEDLPYEPKDPSVAVASGHSAGCCGAGQGLMSTADGRQPRALRLASAVDTAGLAASVGAALALPGVTTTYVPDHAMLVVLAPAEAWPYLLAADGPLAAFAGLVDALPDVQYATGQSVDIPGAPSPYGAYGEPPVTQDEAFAAAQQLSSMYPNIRAIVAQAPDGFYVRVITLGGGTRGGGLGFGGYGSLFGDKGLRRQPAGRGSDWGDVFRAMDRLPSQIGRVRVQIDRLVSGDFAVGGEPGENVPIDEARAAQDKLRANLIDRCKCVLNWMRGVGLDCSQEKCGPGSKSMCSVILLVDGNKMSAEAMEMVPPLVGRVPVRIRDIGDGPVPPFMEIVAP